MKKLMALLLALLTCFAAALADTGSRPEIPQGTLNAEVMPFTPGQTYAVYSAPDSRSIRGAKGRALISAVHGRFRNTIPAANATGTSRSLN